MISNHHGMLNDSGTKKDKKNRKVSPCFLAYFQVPCAFTVPQATYLKNLGVHVFFHFIANKQIQTLPCILHQPN